MVGQHAVALGPVAEQGEAAGRGRLGAKPQVDLALPVVGVDLHVELRRTAAVGFISQWWPRRSPTPVHRSAKGVSLACTPNPFEGSTMFANGDSRQAWFTVSVIRRTQDRGRIAEDQVLGEGQDVRVELPHAAAERLFLLHGHQVDRHEHGDRSSPRHDMSHGTSLPPARRTAQDRDAGSWQIRHTRLRPWLPMD